MSLDLSQLILTNIALADKALLGDGMPTHDLFEAIGGEAALPRKDFYLLLKSMAHNNMLVRGMGKDSRGKLAFTWAIHDKVQQQPNIP